VFGNIKTTADISRVVLADMPKETGIVTAKIVIDKKKENHSKNHPKKNKEVVLNTVKQVPSDERKSKFLPRKKVER